MAGAAQLGAHGLVVVELAVLDRDDAAVLGGDRLVPVRGVDDREPAHAQRDAVGRECPAVVRAAVGHDVGHPVEDLRRHDAPRVPADLEDAADPAHG